MPEFDLKNMSHAEFDSFIRESLQKFAKKVQEDPDYQFARDGERQALGDWFEQWAMGEGLI